MNELDQFLKHRLKVKNYLRYTDDFIIVHENEFYLKELIPQIERFLGERLKLKLHPNKVTIRKLRQGIDFLGYIVLPKSRALRTKTKKRIFMKLKNRIKEYKTGSINERTLSQSLQSYLGVLSHADTHKLSIELKNKFWFWLGE